MDSPVKESAENPPEGSPLRKMKTRTIKITPQSFSVSFKSQNNSRMERKTKKNQNVGIGS